MPELAELKSFLDQKADQYNRPEFIEADPVQVPHLFSEKENIEISAFLTATIAWGNRASIIKNATRLMQWMDFRPHDFILNASQEEINFLGKFVHRTFNSDDCIYFIQALRNIYRNHDGLGGVFVKGYQSKGSVKEALIYFYNVFFDLPGERTRKHVADVKKGASAKRLNMFLRWMVRSDDRGVDFGLWKEIPPAGLFLPLDVHTGRIARKLGLLTRKSNNWKAVEEVTASLRRFDPADPVKYDYALFGLGIFENF